MHLVARLTDGPSAALTWIATLIICSFAQSSWLSWRWVLCFSCSWWPPAASVLRWRRVCRDGKRGASRACGAAGLPSSPSPSSPRGTRGWAATLLFRYPKSSPPSISPSSKVGGGDCCDKHPFYILHAFILQAVLLLLPKPRNSPDSFAWEVKGWHGMGSKWAQVGSSKRLQSIRNLFHWKLELDRTKTQMQMLS